MLKQRARLVAAGLRAVDLAMLAVAFPAAYYLREALVGGARLFPISTYWPLLVASLLVWQLASSWSQLYSKYRTTGLRVELWRLTRAFAVLTVSVTALQFVTKQKDVSRLFFALHYGIAFTLLVANRVALRVAAQAARRRGFNTRTFAVVGSGEMAESIVEAIAQHREWGYRFAGYVLEDGAEPPEGADVLGRLSEMGAILERHVLDEVIFGVPRQRLEDIEPAMLLCEEQGVGVKVILNFFPNRIARLSVEELDGIPMLALASAPVEAVPLAGKRVFDVVVGLLVLVLLSPLLLLLAIAIRLETPGPVLFRQRRIGLNGREFWLYKFRSMHVGAESRLPELSAANEMDGPVFKMKADPRVTGVGRFLRKFSLDELPQFWNVLRGEMSVVGPRPPLPGEVKQYQRWHRRRLSVRPGITCTWQVSGRNEIDFARWMELDLHYIDNWSLWHDLKIVLRTIPAVLLGRGAR